MNEAVSSQDFPLQALCSVVLETSSGESDPEYVRNATSDILGYLDNEPDGKASFVIHMTSGSGFGVRAVVNIEMIRDPGLVAYVDIEDDDLGKRYMIVGGRTTTHHEDDEIVVPYVGRHPTMALIFWFMLCLMMLSGSSAAGGL